MSDHVDYQRTDEIPGLVLSKARLSEYRFDRHFHLDYHIGLVTDGVQRQRFADRTVLLGAGRISLMPPGEMHDGVRCGEGAYTLKTFRVSPELLNSVTEELSGSTLSPMYVGDMLEDATLAYRLDHFHRMICSGAEQSPIALQTEWLTLMGQLFSQSRTIVNRSIKGALSFQQLHSVNNYCNEHLANKVTLEELSALCGIDRFQFLKLFKQTVGMTPHAWLVRLRLERACSMLHHTSRTIGQVALDVGFYDQSHFIRAFRRAYGVVPSHY